MNKIEAGEPLPSRRTVLMGGALILASAAGAGIKLYQRKDAPLRRPIAEGIPKQFAEWSSVDEQGLVRPEEDAGQKSIYDQEVSRVYQTGDAAIMLLIAYGSTQSDTLQVHRPEFCYPAAGFEIGPREQVEVPLKSGGGVPAAFFTAVRKERIEQILYWTRLGDQFPTSWINQHLAQVKNSVRGVVPNGVLVRASVITPDAAAARELLASFLEQLVQRSSPMARTALIGPLAA